MILSKIVFSVEARHRVSPAGARRHRSFANAYLYHHTVVFFPFPYFIHFFAFYQEEVRTTGIFFLLVIQNHEFLVAHDSPFL